jgi:hypothetical protein
MLHSAEKHSFKENPTFQIEMKVKDLDLFKMDTLFHLFSLITVKSIKIQMYIRHFSFFFMMNNYPLISSRIINDHIGQNFIRVLNNYSMRLSNDLKIFETKLMNMIKCLSNGTQMWQVNTYRYLLEAIIKLLPSLINTFVKFSIKQVNDMLHLSHLFIDR